MTRKTRQSQGKKREFLKWLIPLIIAVASLIVQFAVVPIFGLPELKNDTFGKFWMLPEDIPPLHLVYTMSEEGLAQSEYSPSSVYTLQIDQRLTFTNPILWAPSKTYRQPYPGCELVEVMHAEHIEYHQLSTTAVTLRPTERYFNTQTSSIQLVWKGSGCTANAVLLETQRYGNEKVVRVEVENYYQYPVQYLGLVELPPVRTDTVYMIEDSPPMFHPSESLLIWSKDNAEIDSEVNFPFVIELPEYMRATFDIEVSDEPAKISLHWQAYTALPMIVGFARSPWMIVLYVVAIVVIILVFRRRWSRF